MRLMLTLCLLGVALSLSSCKHFSLRRNEKVTAQCTSPCIGQQAPDIDGEDMTGKQLKLSDYRGKVVVLVFWASWCKPCRDMIPHERELVERHRGKPFALLGVNNDENLEAAQKVLASQKMTWPIWKTSGTQDVINDNWCVKSWPAVFVIDSKGVLRFANARGRELENAVDKLLAELK